jgi:hypothetical protein
MTDFLGGKREGIWKLPGADPSTNPFDFAQGSAGCLGGGQDDGIEKRRLEKSGGGAESRRHAARSAA